MFVSAGARERLLADRRQRFAEQYIEPMLVEARRLGMDTADLVSLIQESSQFSGKGST
jgi:GntR family transcriptional regulator